MGSSQNLRQLIGQLMNGSIEINNWATNWRCYRAFSLLLKLQNLNTATINFSWNRLKVISNYERAGVKLEDINSLIRYPDVKED